MEADRMSEHHRNQNKDVSWLRHEEEACIRFLRPGLSSASMPSSTSNCSLEAHLLSDSLILLSMLPDSRFCVVISGIFLPGQEIRAGDYRTEGDRLWRRQQLWQRNVLQHPSIQAIGPLPPASRQAQSGHDRNAHSVRVVSPHTSTSDKRSTSRKT